MTLFRRKMFGLILLLGIVLLTGCSSTGSSSVGGSASYGAYYGGYYDPYPCWGCGGNTIIVKPPAEKPDRPRPPISRPPKPTHPIARPPGGIGRPAARPRRSR